MAIRSYFTPPKKEDNSNNLSKPTKVVYPDGSILVFAKSYKHFDQFFNSLSNHHQYRYASSVEKIQGIRPLKVIVHSSFWDRIGNKQFTDLWEKDWKYQDVPFYNEFGERLDQFGKKD